MANKVTIFGAGSVVFSLGLVKDLCLTKELNGSHVCFMDVNEEVLDVIYELGRRYAEDLSADLSLLRKRSWTELSHRTKVVYPPKTML